MDNQQERQDVKAAYLAGLFEADGSFSLHDNKGKVNQYEPACTFVNTDGELMKTVHEMLDGFGVGHHICSRAQLGFGTKPIFQLQIQGMKRNSKWLPIVRPYMHGIKAKRVDVMIRFIDHRLKTPRNSKYGEFEERCRKDYLALQS